MAAYSSPQGPKHIEPASHVDNYSQCGTQGETSLRPETSGSPGIGGTNHGNTGTQGKH